MIKVELVSDFQTAPVDCIVAVNDTIEDFAKNYTAVVTGLDNFKKFHPKLRSSVSIVPLNDHPANTLIFSPVTSLNDDFDDSRRLYEAANVGIKKAVELGLRRPLLVRGSFTSLQQNKFPWSESTYVELNLLLGALFGAYVPLEIREDVPKRAKKIDVLYVHGFSDKLVNIACGLEEGRRVARDIGGSDPERMAAPNVAKFIEEEFRHSSIKIHSEHVNGEKYPLMAAVNRASSIVPRHDGRIVRLEYDSNDGVEDTIYLVGKGITYDTGGLDIKAGGAMAGMHRDKCGAAAVTGLFKVLDLLKPPKLKVVGLCAYVRNSVGHEGYVADEIITSRAGRRVRIGNTDAEGRMVMADLLCEAKELAQTATNPQLFTVATLTGHAILAYGHCYTAVLGNGTAVDHNIPQLLQAAGDLLAEPVEVSRIQREDVQFHRGFAEYEDILQCNNKPSSQTPRGHQTPAGFLILASGLDENSRKSSKPLPYTHVDCAGSAGGIGSLPTAAPLLMFAARYILPKLR